ncbi:hypothetical protein [Alphaproteobacteria bacterium endosymbiont of Tiliacea citrago]|uniref:hypothetical protein n=1 Tax=Alphaproteobacteria bacterium endosymbiont of Tiliacea citrago TaxID=3077944 RepID=UPI00313D72D2
MNNKIKNILLTLPFFAFSEDKKADISPSNFAWAAGAYAGYLYGLESFSVGAFLGAEYSFAKKINAFIGATVVVPMNYGAITGFRFMGGALLGQKQKFDETKNADYKKLNEAAIGYLKGGFGILAVDTAYYFSVGIQVKCLETSVITRAFTYSIVLMPKAEVIDCVEVGALFSVGYHKAAKAKDISDKTVSDIINKVYVLDNAEKISASDLTEDQKKANEKSRKVYEAISVNSFNLVEIANEVIEKAKKGETAEISEGASSNGSSQEAAA